MSEEKTADEVMFCKEYLEKQKQEKLKEKPLTDEELASCFDERDSFQKISDWWNNLPVKPYVTIRDLSDPFGDRKNDPFDDGSGSKHGAEIGIKFTF